MPASGKEFYIPHKAVVRENAQTTKMRIVYDASSRANQSSPSLNDCLETGPPLQNMLWKVLVRARFHPIALIGDIRKAFLQVRIRAADRDALRFHWLHGKDKQRVRTLRFTRALFGLAPSPFLLAGVIQHHLNAYRDNHPELVKEIERSLYVDDLVSGGETVKKGGWCSRLRCCDSGIRNQPGTCRSKVKTSKARPHYSSPGAGFRAYGRVTTLHCWLDSTVALHWVQGDGEFRQFVGNRVQKIREHDEVKWRHVPTHENPADLASRGRKTSEENRLWYHGPEWLSNDEEWPPNIVTTTESNAELKATKQIFALAIVSNDELYDLLAKTNYWRIMRLCAWITRFVENARKPKERRVTGQTLKSEEIEAQEQFWVLRVQRRGSETHQEDRERLNLQENEDGVLECRGRIQGLYPIYLPDTSTLAEKFVQHAHKTTLHGGTPLDTAS